MKKMTDIPAIFMPSIVWRRTLFAKNILSINRKLALLGKNNFDCLSVSDTLRITPETVIIPVINNTNGFLYIRPKGG